MRNWKALLGGAAVVLFALEASAFQVNTHTTGDQRLPSVTYGADGKFTVVWDSNADAPNLGVYARRYDPTGVAVGTTIAVSTAGLSRSGAVSAAADGGFVVAWTQKDTLPDGYGIRARRYDSTGAPAGTSFQVNSFTPYGQRHPDVAHHAAGNFVVVWQGFGQDNPDLLGGVFAQQFDAAGAPAGSEFQVNSFTPGNQGTSLAVASLPAGGFIVAWYSELQDGGRGGTFAQIYDSSGATVGGEFQVNTATAGFQGSVGIDIGVDALGNFTVVYSSMENDTPNLLRAQVYAQSFNSVGGMVGTEFQINQGRRGFSPEIAMKDDGSFLATYEGADAEGKGVLGMHFAPDGTPVGREFRVSSEWAGTQEGGSIASNGTDQFFAAWQSECLNFHRKCEESEDGNHAGVFARRWVTTQPTCPAVPKAGCFAAGKSVLKLSQSGGGRMLWKWQDGPAFNVGHVGTPANDLTDYVLCMYREDGGTPALVMSATVPGGDTCGSQPCWKANGKGTSAKYKNASATPDGVDRITVKTGARGKVLVKGRGPNIPLPLPIGSFTKVTTQLITEPGDCWDAEFDSAPRNDATSFKARF